MCARSASVACVIRTRVTVVCAGRAARIVIRLTDAALAGIRVRAVGIARITTARSVRLVWVHARAASVAHVVGALYPVACAGRAVGLVVGDTRAVATRIRIVAIGVTPASAGRSVGLVRVRA